MGSNQQQIKSSEHFDFSHIQTAEAAGSNALFLKIDGIPGSSAANGHRDEIDLLWYCFGFRQRTDLRACNADEGKNVFDKTDFDGFHFIMEENRASPKLMTAYLNKTTINTAVLSAQ